MEFIYGNIQRRHSWDLTIQQKAVCPRVFDYIFWLSAFIAWLLKEIVRIFDWVSFDTIAKPTKVSFIPMRQPIEIAKVIKVTLQHPKHKPVVRWR